MKSFRFLGLIVLAAAALSGQSMTPPTTGAQYWSTDSTLDCSATGSSTYTISLASGGTGYVCIVSGTFPWLAAGGAWTTSIRASAPAAGAIGVDYSFYDKNGNSLTLDTTSGTNTVPASANELSFALTANGPSEVHLLGASSEAPGYRTEQDGSAYAIFYCPNADTCATVLPQLIYSSLPSQPWSLSVPIAWDNFFSAVQVQGAWTQWSASGIDDGTAAHRVSLAIYNQMSTSTIFTVSVYDSNGKLAGQGTTAAIPGFNSVTQQAGTYGKILTDIIKSPLPSGIFKITVDGGSNYSSVVILQFTGGSGGAGSGTSLQVAYDTSSATSSLASTAPSSLVKSAVRQKAQRPRLPFNVVPK